MERVAGIEPASSAWKADVLPLYDTRRIYKEPTDLKNTTTACPSVVPRMRSGGGRIVRFWLAAATFSLPYNLMRLIASVRSFAILLAMLNLSPITVETTVNAPIEKVWACWTEPEHIKQWNSASDDWHTPSATNDLREGGEFTARMEAKDGSVGFDFGGTYTKVIDQRQIDYTMDDGRTVSITFDEHDGHTHVTETFDPETENPREMQQQGWQSIMDNFKKHVESHA
jgi:uncharacterized protein YndB with AHSA1/START domain